jgi:PadR family transcriptional regulator
VHLGPVDFEVPCCRRDARIGNLAQSPEITGGTFVLKPGSLVPALHRMEEEGWISSFWGDSENNRRAKFYRLNRAGRKQLEVETKRWDRVSWAIEQALETS